jgi:glutaminyl-peptide cyclotransferase
MNLRAAIRVMFAVLAVAFALWAHTMPSTKHAWHGSTRHRAAPARISGAHAMEYVRQIVAFGPRPVGSPAHKRLEEYLRAHLRSDNLEEDAFTASTPDGQFPMRNFIAKFPGKRDGIIVISGHYDTLKKEGFVGANDGGSSAGLLLALADYFRVHKPAGYSVWLVWFDGEEAFRQWSDQDSTYGSRHLAEKWRKDGTSGKIKAFLLLDMIGDAGLDVLRDANSTPWLQQLVQDAATKLGYQSHFFGRTDGIEDDHIPFAKLGVPVVDLIDFDYGFSNVFWHSTEDTLDKLSPESLEIVGSTVVNTVPLIDARK